MKLKVCGMKFEKNIAEIGAINPDYLGFIFYNKSPRHFSGALPELPDPIKKVGVFVNSSLAIVIENIDRYSLQAVQLHGGESAKYCLALKQAFEKRALQIEIIKVFSIKDNFDFNQLDAFETVCDFYLFDTKGRLPGGNGIEFNWSVLADYPSSKPYFLSGGIGLTSTDDITAFLKSPAAQFCHAIDVNSKFEIEPGRKDVEGVKKMKASLSND